MVRCDAVRWRGKTIRGNPVRKHVTVTVVIVAGHFSLVVRACYFLAGVAAPAQCGSRGMCALRELSGRVQR